MDDVRYEMGSKDRPTLRKGASIEEPGQQECPVCVRRELDTVQRNCSSKHPLLVFGGIMAFKAGAHRAGSESTLCNVPQVTEHGLEDEVIIRRAETQAALKDIVAILVQK